MMIMISVLNRVLQSIPDHDIIVFDVVETTWLRLKPHLIEILHNNRVLQLRSRPQYNIFLCCQNYYETLINTTFECDSPKCIKDHNSIELLMWLIFKFMMRKIWWWSRSLPVESFKLLLLRSGQASMNRLDLHHPTAKEPTLTDSCSW
jgi:hypothetical protein